MTRYIFYIIFFFSCAISVVSQAQVTVYGKIFDNDTRLPLYRATVKNSRTGMGAFTDSLGNYEIQAQLNDWIIFSFIGYAPDSARIKKTVRNATIINVFLRPGYYLSQLTVNGRRIDYTRDSLERRELYGTALSEQKTSGLGAVMHPISGLFDALSKKQKQIWHFQKIEKQFEQDQYIKSRIKISLVEKLTNLHGDTLKLFLENYYHPYYAWVRIASDYELYQDIINAANKFKQILDVYPPLHDSTFMKPPEDTAG